MTSPNGALFPSTPSLTSDGVLSHPENAIMDANLPGGAGSGAAGKRTITT
ncbi:MAG: hypothetical protein HY340_02910 [Candidatus Kerfeldbacteria bacterium]|nr:hypothetical protein [Candidatus Kerfeldbacteria bacterium]